MIKLLWTMILAFVLVLPSRGGALLHYTDPDQQIKIPFGERSHWAQPWRAYLETMPATTFLNGTGVNDTAQGDPDIRIQHLARHGFAHVRLEVGWGSIDFQDDTKLDGADRLRPILLACKKWHVRPLILLNAHQGAPCPLLDFVRVVVEAARKGDRQVTLDDTGGLVPGHSGLSGLTSYWAAEALITGISGHVVTLSKPLPKDIPAGSRVPMATLEYRPFSAPGSDDYRVTVGGWLNYVDAVARFARSALGTDGAADAGFDLEVWNELTFGSEFLYVNHYYDPPLTKYDERSIWGNLVRETADHVEAHRDLFSGVRIGDGFANTIPWPASSLEPPGVSAIDKHPYIGRLNFPGPSERRDLPMLNALLARDTSGWEPSYTCLFPEYYACVIQTETLTREMSPIVTDVGGTPHGRNARVPPVSTWITEVNMAPDEYLPDVDATAARYLKGKTTARYFTFFLNKGVTLLTLFADAGGGDRGLALESDTFLTYAGQPGAMLPPDDGALTSPALCVTGNIAARMRPGLDPALTPQTTRHLTLDRIADTHDHFQFAGDGTPAHPALYDRDVFAFLPFQVNARTFVIPYYVMTRDVAHVYDPAKAGGHQYDMPAEDFTLTIGGLHGRGARVTAYDPLNDRPVPIKTLGGDAHTLTVRVPAVDYPYLLIVRERYGHGAPCPYTMPCPYTISQTAWNRPRARRSVSRDQERMVMPASRSWRRRQVTVHRDRPVSRTMASRPIARHCTQVSQSTSARSVSAVCAYKAAFTCSASRVAHTAATCRAEIVSVVSTAVMKKSVPLKQKQDGD